MLGVFAEFETSERRERQLEGIARAKANGVYVGKGPPGEPYCSCVMTSWQVPVRVSPRIAC
jgi:DNA invertase Pin-like site-specific DNA recombinase